MEEDEAAAASRRRLRDPPGALGPMRSPRAAAPGGLAAWPREGRPLTLERAPAQAAVPAAACLTWPGPTRTADLGAAGTGTAAPETAGTRATRPGTTRS